MVMGWTSEHPDPAGVGAPKPLDRRSIGVMYPSSRSGSDTRMNPLGDEANASPRSVEGPTTPRALAGIASSPSRIPGACNGASAAMAAMGTRPVAR